MLVNLSEAKNMVSNVQIINVEETSKLKVSYMAIKIRASILLVPSSVEKVTVKEGSLQLAL
jgi:hypothetical protein